MSASTARVVRVVAVVAAVFGLGLAAMPAARAVDGVEPKTVEVALDPGGTHTVDETVHTPEVSANPDIMFLADLTGSMGDALANVQANAGTVMSTIGAAQPSAQFGAAFYRDFACDSTTAFGVSQAITATSADVQAALDAWTVGGGCDTPEDSLAALYELATSPAAGWRTGSSRIVAWFGDATSHDPSNGHTLAETTAALQAAGIRVVAVDIEDLDGLGQAAAITSGTGGVIVPGGEDVSDAILAGIQDLDAEVTVSPTCDDGLQVYWVPDSQTVPAGTDATFTETFSVADTAEPGTTLHCSVQFLINGGADADHLQDVIVHVGGGGELTPTEMVPMKAGAMKTRDGDLKVPIVWSQLVDPATGEGIAGKTVGFYVGEELLCEGTTRAHGWVTCGGEVEGAGDSLGDGYEVRFAGDDTYEASSAEGSFFPLVKAHHPKPPHCGCHMHWAWDWASHHHGARH